MRIAIILFAFGVWLCQQQARLPDFGVVAAGGVLCALLAVLCVWRGERFRPGVWLVAAPLGFCFAAGAGLTRLADTLPHESEGRDITVTGVVATMPQRYGSGVRFEFLVEQASLPAPQRVWLSWYGGADDDEQAAAPVHAGERWRLVVRLKRPHGNLNPNGFDYEALLFERGLRATGYVRSDPGNARVEAFVWSVETAIEALRERVRSRLERVLRDAEYGGVIIALVVGDQRAVEQEFWAVFNRTGITHLMAISGFHITMIAALMAAVGGFVWARLPGLALRLPAQKMALLVGWLAALGYCLIAGMGVPAQRTLFMLTLVMGALFFDRQVSPSRLLCASLFLVLLFDPLAVLAAGFWLSFMAVAMLMYGCSGALTAVHWLKSAVKSQWVVTLGLMPVLLALFGQFSIVSPLANAIAIPVVSFMVTPLALGGAFLGWDVLLHLSHLLLSWLMVPIEWLSGVPWAVWVSHTPPLWAVVMGMVGCVVLFLPRGVPLRALGVMLLLPLVWVVPPRAAPGEATVTVLDVGQGLAVHVQTAHHDLLFDTGPAFSPEANSGNRVIVPYLRSLGVSTLSLMVVSHDDRDHSGGVHSVAEGMRVLMMRDSLAANSALRPPGVPNEPCGAGDAWEWDGVRFEILHPAATNTGYERNDRSCVLRVTAGGQRLLIPADIEARAERDLLARSQDLAADFLIAPHHGSRTSSTPEFLAAVNPREVIFPVGYRNRYRHPNKDVWSRYVATGARLWRTDADGAVRLTLGGAAHIERTRDVRRRYWHDEPPATREAVGR